MTVESTTNRAQYATNGTTGPWTVPWQFYAKSDVQVIYADANGNETVLGDSDYSVTGTGDESGGTVTTTTAYGSGGTITLLMAFEALQEVDYTETDAFPAETHERALDLLTRLVQQLKEVVGRALVIAPSENNTVTLPMASARANKVVAFDSDGDLTVLVPTSGSAADVLTQLANSASASLGPALVGYGGDLSYAEGTIGGALGQWRTLRDFGCVGNDSTDDTTNFRAALTWAKANNGVIYVTPGTYKVTGYVTIENGVRGLVGAGGTIKFYSSTGNAGIFLRGIEDGAAADVDNCEISRLIINCNSQATNQTNAIIGQNCTNCRITDNYIFNLSLGHGIFIYSFESGTTGANGNIISRNRIYGDTAGGASAPLRQGGYYGIAVTSEYDLGIYADQGAHWKATWTVAASTKPQYRNIICNNIIVGGYYGIGASDIRYCVIASNILVSQVRSISAQNTCLANTIEGNVCIDSLSSGIHLAYGSNYNRIVGNTIYTSASVGEALIEAYVSVSGNVIRGNSVTVVGVNKPQYHCYIGIHANGNDVSENTFVGLASNAYIGLESAWNTATTDPASYAYGKPGSVNLFANAGSSGNVIADNVIDGSDAVPAMFMHQESDGGGGYALTATTVRGNIVRSNSHNYQLRVVEDNVGNLTGALVGNQFNPSATAAKFSATRGLAHWYEMTGNAMLQNNGALASFTSTDTTPDVSFGESFACANASPTSITMFDNGRDGQEIKVRLDANTTIVHNASYIVLKGAGNIASRTTADFVRLLRISGVWFEQSRSW